MSAKKLGLWSGVGLTMSDMVGVGVLTTAGFMAKELSPSLILLDWFVGGVAALAGALAYAALARQVPRSGGEYRYLSSMLHPAAGYLAGWTSFLVGFSVPVALSGLAAGAFGETLFLGIDPRHTAAVIIVAITAAHAGNLQASKWTQDLLAIIKAGLLAAFVAIGLLYGTNELPVWEPHSTTPDDGGFPVGPFFTSLIFISMAYTGWNAATYASEEFKNPRRDVPRAMIIGCSLVMAVYMLVNWVFVTNLSQADMTWVAEELSGDTESSRITLAHLVMENLIGDDVAAGMSVVVIIALMSAISAMTLIGPRVYAAMAKDGFLPRVLIAKQGKPPLGSVVLQGGLAILLVYLSHFRELLNNVSSILAVVSGITVLSLFRTSRWRKGEHPSMWALAGAIVYAVLSGWMVWFGIKASPSLVLWMLAIVAISMVAFVVTRIVRPDAGRSERHRGSDQADEDWARRRGD